MRHCLAILSLLLLQACSNPYADYYKGLPDARALPNYVPSVEDVQLFSTNNFDPDVHVLVRQGFIDIGYSSFNAADSTVSEKQVKDQAKKIGAQIVLVGSRYTHTMSGAIPITVPNVSTSYSTGTATAYGAGGTVNVFGSGTTTTYGDETVMVPYSERHSDYVAVYFIKVKLHLGLYFNKDSEQIDIQTRKAIGTNAGIRISEIVEESPAFRANIFSGDIILSIDDDEVYSHQQYMKLLNKYAGQSVTLKIYRDGKVLRKTVEIAK
jgi:hypothetical protein